MKIAVLISGGLRLCFNETAQNIFEVLVKKYDADVFMSFIEGSSIRKDADSKKTKIGEDMGEDSYPNEVEMLKDIFGDSIKKIELVGFNTDALYNKELDEIYKKSINKLEKKINESNNSDQFGDDVTVRIRKYLDQLLRLKRCCKLMEEYETVNGFKYDFVIRLRIDFLFPREVFEYQYEKENIYFCETWIRNSEGDPTYLIDTFFLGNRDKLSYICNNLVTSYGDYEDENKRDGDQTFTMECQLGYFILNNNIKIQEIPVSKKINWEHPDHRQEMVWLKKI